jgi:signal transduction histidine kinase
MNLNVTTDLDQSQSGVERIDALNALAWDLRNDETERSLALADEAKMLAEKKSYAKGLAESLRTIGFCYYNLSKFDAALSVSKQVLALFTALIDKTGEAQAADTIDIISQHLGDYTSALDYQLRSLKLQQAIGDQHGEANSLARVGHVYADLGDYAKALAYHLKALEIQHAIGDRYGEANSLLALGMLYATQAFEAHSTSEALRYLHKALSSAQNLEAKELICESCFALFKVYKQSGDYAKALDNHEALLVIKEEMFNEQKNNKAKSQQIQFEFEQSRKEAELRGQEDELQRKEIELRRQETESFRLKTLELSMANVALQQANRLKTELLGIAAHDLKNPLQAIMGFAALIKEGSLATPEEVNEFASLIENSSQRMFSIITDLLQTAALGAGKLELELVEADISAIVQEVAANNWHQAESKGQRLIVSAPKGCLVKIDTNRMSEVLDNLISNAIKYSPRKKNIWITARKDNDTVRVEVKDEGQGLSEKDLILLFGRFQRLSAKPTGGESSTGLGLSIVKELVERHGGKVWAASEGKDKGSRFVVELPAA